MTDDTTPHGSPRVAVVTGASQGLGFELARSLVGHGWSVIVDARDADRLRDAATSIEAAAAPGARVVAIAGDVTDPAHVQAITSAARRAGTVRLVVNNASTLGSSPLPRLVELEDTTLRRILDVNVVAPVALVRSLAADLGTGATVVEITSDAGVEPYPGWGGYGASKAALEHVGRVLAAEHPEWRVLVVDPGDMRTQMHQDAFPGEDISDRADPAERATALAALVAGDAPSGRYTLASPAVGAP